MLFGARKSVFGTTGINPDADYGGVGMGGLPMDAMNAAPKKKGLFGKGLFADILGGVGDALAQNAGLNPNYAAQQEMKRRQSMFEQQRAADMEDYRQKQEIEAQYRAPPQPTEFERLAASAYGQGTPEYMKAVQGYVESRANPMMPVQGVDANGNPTLTFMPRNGGAPAPTGPAVGTMRGGYRFKGGNPNDRGSWEPVGGQTPPASGNFR